MGGPPSFIGGEPPAPAPPPAPVRIFDIVDSETRAQFARRHFAERATYGSDRSEVRAHGPEAAGVVTRAEGQPSKAASDTQ